MPPFYSGEDCDSLLVKHNCNPCPTIKQREFGRVRSVFFVFADYHATLLAGIIDPEVWRAGIAAGKVIVIPETSGEYDPGDPKTLKGYGDRPESYGTRTATLHFFDPNLVDNYEYYNQLGGQTELIPGFRTSSQVRLFDTPAAITAKDPVQDDIESEISWDVTAKVITDNIPVYHPAATLLNTVFKCSWINNIEVTQPGTSFDTILAFASGTANGDGSLTKSAENVSVTVPAADPTVGFEFDAIPGAVGLPNNMNVMIGSILVAIVVFKAEYLTKPFKYTHTDGTVYVNGVFTAGDKTLVS